MSESGPMRDEGREPTQPIELEDVDDTEQTGPRPIARAHSAPPPLPPELRAARPTPSVPPLSPAGERMRVSGVHRVERGSLPPGASVPPPPPPAGAPARASVAPSVAPPSAAASQPVLAPTLRPSAAPGAGSLVPPAPAASLDTRALQEELRTMTAHRDRLRLRTVRQQERIEQLERELSQRSEELRLAREALSSAQSSAAKDLGDLRRIQGIGPAFDRALKQHGVTSIEAIAAWTHEDVIDMARKVGTTPHRIERDGWVASARKLLGLQSS